MDPRTQDLVYGRVVRAEGPEWRAKPMIPGHTQGWDVGDGQLVPSDGTLEMSMSFVPGNFTPS